MQGAPVGILAQPAAALAMRRCSARTTWCVYEAAASFLGLLAFTVTAVHYVTEVGMSPLQLTLVGMLMEVAIFVFEIPTVGLIGNAFSGRAALSAGALCMVPALGLHRRTARHHGEVAALEALPVDPPA